MYPSTVGMERFAGLNIHGFSSMKLFAEILSLCIGHQCLLLTYSKIHGKLLRQAQKPRMPWKFSPENLSPFTVYLKKVLTCLSGRMTKPQNHTHHGQFALYVCRESITITGLYTLWYRQLIHYFSIGKSAHTYKYCIYSHYNGEFVGSIAVYLKK